MCCEIIYNKIYHNTTFCRTISNVEKVFDPDSFAKWLTEAFLDSSYKSWEQIAKDLKNIRGATRSTLSRYAGAKPQFLTNKPSQPNSDLVIGLAKLFKKDANEALLLAGHAPIDVSNTETIELNENVRIQLLNAKDYSEEDKQEFMRDFQTAFEIAKRRINDKKKQNE